MKENPEQGEDCINVGWPLKMNQNVIRYWVGNCLYKNIHPATLLQKLNFPYSFNKICYYQNNL